VKLILDKKGYTMDVISEFKGEYRFLSNFFTSPFNSGVLYPMHTMFVLQYPELIVFPSVEAFFQSMKATSPEIAAKIGEMRNPADAKRAGRNVDIRQNWLEIREFVMKAGLVAKYHSNPALSSGLVDTAPAFLIEGNYWGDSYWGYDLKRNFGHNRLGSLTMDVRHLLTPPQS